MDKSLKSLNRVELLGLLMKASEINEALIAENNELRRDRASQPQLPQSTKVGSIAEAALQANGYFEAAQKAADDYLREIVRLRDHVAARAAAQAQQQSVAAGATAQPQPDRDAQEQAQAQAQARLRDAQTQADQLLAQANAQAQAIVANAQAQADAIVADANRQSHAMLLQATRQIGQQPQPQAQPQPAGSPSGYGETGPLMRRGRHVRLDG